MLKSRVHLLNHPFSNVYIKREDELSCGISGSKLRKYQSLIPFLKKNHFTDVLIQGGSASNHVVGILQVLKEQGITPHCFFFAEDDKILAGNRMLTRLLLKADEVTYFSRAHKTSLLPLLEEKKLILEERGRRVFVLPEGANCPEAVEGASTLAKDILRNEEELGIKFENIFVDAGTGLTARALILGLSRHIHVALCAGTKEQFLSQLGSPLSDNFSTYDGDAKSFGNPKEKHFLYIKKFAEEQGVLLDPIYGAKLFPLAEEISKKFTTPSLIIHSGGAHSLHGFQVVK